MTKFKYWCLHHASNHIVLQDHIILRETPIGVVVEVWVHDSTHHGSNLGAHNYAVEVSPCQGYIPSCLRTNLHANSKVRDSTDLTKFHPAK